MDNLISLVSPQTKFEFLSMEDELVRAIEVDGKKMLHGVASSTTKDLHGDTIVLSALEDMERTAVGMTIFLNHKYELPGDVGGTVTKAIIKKKGVDQNGDPNYQLEFDIEVEDDNPAAVQTWKYIKKGRKLGLSIGAMIPEGGAKRQKDGSYIIEHVILLETSLVGIPANPKSWVDYAASALRGMVEKATTTTLGNPTLTLEAGRYKIEGSLDGLDLNLGEKPEFAAISYSFIEDEMDESKVTILRTAEGDTGMLQVVMLGSWDLNDPDDRLLAIASSSEEVVAKATVWVETRDGDKITIGDEQPAGDVSADAEPEIIEAGACPSCGGSKGGPKGDCKDKYHSTSSAEPSVTDAKIRIIEVDTDEPQGASSSEPDDVGETLAAPEAVVTAEGEPLILDGLAEDELLKLSFNQLRAVALRSVTELVAAKQALAEEKVARAVAEKQRDEVTDAAAELVQRTAKVIEKIASAPLPRKAILRGIESEFSSSVEAYYGTAFARALADKK